MIRKTIKGGDFKSQMVGELVFDQVPKEGSFNPVTSDAVVKAIDEAKEDMQEKIDEVTLDPSAVAFGNVHLLDEVTEFPADGCILIDSETNGPGEMSKDTLLELTAQNALAGNVAPAFDPTRTSENPYKKGERVVYSGDLFIVANNHYGDWLADDFKAVDIADYIGNTDLKPISYETGKYATVTGSPSHVSLVSNANAVVFKYDVSQFSFTLYETTRRITASIPICVFADADGLSLGYNFPTSADIDNYQVTIPHGTKYVYVNCNVGYYSRLYLSQADFNDYAYNIFLSQNAEKITIAPETMGGWAAYDNANFRKIFDRSGMKFAVVKTADLFGAKKIYVSTDPASILGRVAFFYDSCGKVLGSVDSQSAVSNLEVVIPEGTDTIYINCRSDKSMTYYYYKDIDVAIDAIYENVGKLNNLFAIATSDFAKKFAIHRASVYSDSFKEFSIRKFGWDSDNLKFIVELQSGNTIIPMEHRFTAAPTGRQVLSFIGSSTNFVYAEFEIDFDALPLQYFEPSSDEIIVAVSPCNNLEHINGVIDYTFNGRCHITDGIRLQGQKCTINVYDANGCFLLYSNACLSGIIFNDKGATPLVREEYSAAEIEEKPSRRWLFKPVLSLQDLSEEDTDVLIGENVDYVVLIHDNAVNALLTSCTFNNFNRGCVDDHGERHEGPKHSIIENNMFNSCRLGIYTSGETPRHSKNYFVGCLIGLWIHANDYNAVHCNFLRCDCGMYFDSYQDAHGEVSTFHFAHNGLAGVYAKTINNDVGFMFTNCQFAQANIIAEVAYALKLTGCRVDSFIQILSGAKNSVIGCNMRNYIALDEGHSSVFDVPADTLLALNRSVSSSGNDADYNNS